MINLTERDFVRYRQPDEESPLEHLFVVGLQEIYWSENHLVRVLLKMRNASSSRTLRGIIDSYFAIAKRHVHRQEQILELLDEEIDGRKCESVYGLSKEIDDAIEYTDDGSATRDAALVILLEKVIVFCSNSYESAIRLAQVLGRQDITDILIDSSAEENLSLTELRKINDHMLHKAHIE